MRTVIRFPDTVSIYARASAVGRTEHSTPAAEIIGSATVNEQRPTPEMSCTAKTLFCLSIIPQASSSISAVTRP